VSGALDKDEIRAYLKFTAGVVIYLVIACALLTAYKLFIER